MTAGTAPWSKRGPELREMARRLAAGERPAEIAQAMSLSPWVAQTKCKEIAAALKLPTDADRRAELDRRVAPLVEAGLTDLQIAEKLGVSYSRVIGSRRRALGPKFTILRLTSAEHARIDQMVAEGFSPAKIAAEVGCSPSLVVQRATRLPRTEIVPTKPPCDCGKAAGHLGRCRATVPADLVRQRLLAGATSADIAREVGLKPGVHFKATYCQPVIDQLTAEGRRCGWRTRSGAAIARAR